MELLGVHKFRVNLSKTYKCLNLFLSVISNPRALYRRVSLICATKDPYIIKINIRCVPVYFWWGPLSKFLRAESSAQSQEGCARCLVSLFLAQVSHIQCMRELLVPLLLGPAEKQQVRKKKTPPRRNDSRYWRAKEASKVNAISKGK